MVAIHTFAEEQFRETLQSITIGPYFIELISDGEILHCTVYRGAGS